MNIRCGTCGSDSLIAEDSKETFQYLSESEGVYHTVLTGAGTLFVKCCLCGRSMMALYHNNRPSRIYPRQYVAYKRMLTAFEGRSRRSRWAKCIVDSSIPVSRPVECTNMDYTI